MNRLPIKGTTRKARKLLQSVNWNPDKLRVLVVKGGVCTLSKFIDHDADFNIPLNYMPEVLQTDLELIIYTGMTRGAD